MEEGKRKLLTSNMSKLKGNYFNKEKEKENSIPVIA
jgi:hypothetical protein